ncbi:glycosyl transferase [Nitrosopumilus cobalaminigenes]|uniref:Glycosyl transferase n=1 Tax=Nitrosopumilus cobalaminigenes TaxID=1470066 RepID=A0A7D5LYA5_9ARCH|nr:glycosyltransferase family 4 protein [Nitrosopumilus cobalaminigenes]QLH02193.1 glycosyl transferase [Nitrosopumilus cobalaminigenes]
MKFLFISPRYSGGIGGHAAMLAHQLENFGHSVTKMETPHIPIKNLKNPSFAILGALKGIMNRQNYDIVHAFNIPSGFAMHYSKGQKKILSAHGVYSDQVKVLHSSTTSKIATSAESRVFKWADKLTTDSQITKKEYKKKFNLDLEYLPSPIDTEMFKKIPEVKKITNQVAYVGRDSFEKGIDILKSIESKINGNVVYCVDKPWDETMKILKSSRLLVVPSRMESLPTVIKEAFYLKIPVIASSVGGIPELVTHNETGILTESENPQLLLKNINELLIDESLQQKLSSNAYDFVIKHFTWKKILPKYLNFYENLLKN